MNGFGYISTTGRKPLWLERIAQGEDPVDVIWETIQSPESAVVAGMASGPEYLATITAQKLAVLLGVTGAVGAVGGLSYWGATTLVVHYAKEWDKNQGASAGDLSDVDRWVLGLTRSAMERMGLSAEDIERVLNYQRSSLGFSGQSAAEIAAERLAGGEVILSALIEKYLLEKYGFTDSNKFKTSNVLPSGFSWSDFDSWRLGSKVSKGSLLVEDYITHVRTNLETEGTEPVPTGETQGTERATSTLDSTLEDLLGGLVTDETTLPAPVLQGGIDPDLVAFLGKKYGIQYASQYASGALKNPSYSEYEFKLWRADRYASGETDEEIAFEEGGLDYSEALELAMQYEAPSPEQFEDIVPDVTLEDLRGHLGSRNISSDAVGGYDEGGSEESLTRETEGLSDSYESGDNYQEGGYMSYGYGRRRWSPAFRAGYYAGLRKGGGGGYYRRRY